MQKHTYFTSDGTFGDADAMVVYRTSHWTEEDWAEIENVPDSERLYSAETVALKYEQDSMW